MSSARKRLERLTDGLLFEFTSVMALVYKVRPLPSIVQRWRDKTEAALIEAMMIGQYENRDPREGAPFDDPLEDTRPIPRTPTPLPPKR